MEGMKNESLDENVTDVERTLGALLRKPYQILVARVYRGLAERGFADVRPAHSAVFRHVTPDGLRITELAERAQMTKQSMGYLVDYLHRHGYVLMRLDPSDGRAKLVCLTDRGLAVQQAALEMSRQLERELAGALGEAEFRHLRTLMDQVILYLERTED